MSAVKQQNSFPLRMPDNIRAQLEARAKANGRSANAEIVAILGLALEAQSSLAVLPVEVLLREVVDRLGATVQIVVPGEAAARAGIANE
jgi:plasmid stability protein